MCYSHLYVECAVCFISFFISFNPLIFFVIRLPSLHYYIMRVLFNEVFFLPPI